MSVYAQEVRKSGIRGKFHGDGVDDMDDRLTAIACRCFGCLLALNCFHICDIVMCISTALISDEMRKLWNATGFRVRADEVGLKA